eukprot:scaffold3789_cov247-Chaetoceros_neogracile.AAC.4
MLLVALLNIVFLLMVFFYRTEAIRESNYTNVMLHNRPSFRDPRSAENLASGEVVWSSFKNVNKIRRGNPKIAAGTLFDNRAGSQLTRHSSDLHEFKEFHIFSDRHGLNQTTVVDRATIAQLQNQAQDGSLDSSYFLGFIYLYGLDSSSSDAVKALKWFKEAAIKGHSEAQCVIGMIFYDGIGAVGKDRKTAMRWFYQCASAESELLYSHWLLGKAMYEGLTFEDIGVRTKDAVAALKILPAYYNGLGGTPSTHIIAAHLFIKADNVNQAIHYLAIMHEYGLIPHKFPDIDIPMLENPLNRVHTPNFERAAELYRQASRMGSVDSLYNLALMYAYGRGVPLNHARAIDSFRQATFWKHAPSMQYLGQFAMKGWGQPNDSPNVEEALAWFSQCIQHNTSEEQRKICEKEMSELQLVVQKAESIYKTITKKDGKKPKRITVPQSLNVQ